ncbi:MFS transporter [Allobranchiibius sp. CTAmp26]|uniref:MFS transporter n=1 Tax=Allobranchiibius sp. CTAmp26 TaxID=2815214 RepID=UPI001AA0B46C|nr:MFS transporter [Allobranchiibius sp. CTAmp26]MBO1756954.1 MFS transporter [Allobranchiibius sp. CTAmp26]
MTDYQSTSAASSTRANLQTAAIGLGALMAALAQTLILPLLPTISAEIGASGTQSSWLLTSTLLVAAVSVPIVSRLADMFGRRLMLQVSLAALAGGSVIAALTDNVTIMIAGRALQGMSAAAIPLGISLLAVTLPEHRRGSATAMVSAMLGVGGALGLPLAGLIGEHFDYHVLYWIAAVGAVVSLGLVSVLVQESENSGETRIDAAGVALLAGGLVCLVLPLAQGSAWGWGSLRVLGLFTASVLLLGLLVVVERRATAPLVDMTALSNPPVALTNIASVFIGFALFASFVGTSNYVQAPRASGYGFDASVLTAGLTLLPSGLLMLALSPVASKLISAWGPARVLSLAGVIIAAGLVMRILVTGSLWQIIVGSAIVGVGTGIGYAALPSLINAHSPAQELAAANGINALARSLGSSLASAVGGSILAAITINLAGHGVASLTGYRVLFAICAGAALTAALSGLLIDRIGQTRSDPREAEQAQTPATAR